MLIKSCFYVWLCLGMAQLVFAGDLDDGITIEDAISDQLGSEEPNINYIRSKVQAAKQRGDKDIIVSCNAGNTTIEGNVSGPVTVINVVGGNGKNTIYCDDKNPGKNPKGTK